MTRSQRAGRLARQLKLLSFSLRAPAFALAVVTCWDVFLFCYYNLLGFVYVFVLQLLHYYYSYFPHCEGV